MNIGASVIACTVIQKSLFSYIGASNAFVYVSMFVYVVAGLLYIFVVLISFFKKIFTPNFDNIYVVTGHL